MGTYYITRRNPVNQQIMLQALQNLSSLGSDYMKGQFALGREKELAQFKQDIELPDLEKSPMAVLGARYDKIASELTQKETEALMSGNPDKLKEVKRAKNELKLLQETLRERRQQEVEKRTKQAMESRKTEADINLTEARTEYFKTAPPRKDYTKMTVGELRAQLLSVQSMIQRYEKSFSDIPEELILQQEEIKAELEQARKRQGLSTKPKPTGGTVFGPPAPPNLSGKSTDDLWKSLNKGP